MDGQQNIKLRNKISITISCPECNFLNASNFGTGAAFKHHTVIQLEGLQGRANPEN
jgi:hypothetical protein